MPLEEDIISYSTTRLVQEKGKGGAGEVCMVWFETMMRPNHSQLIR